MTFNQLNTEGYDRVYCDGKVLNIPNGYDKLERNMNELFPESRSEAINRFVNILRDFRNRIYRVSQKLRADLSSCERVAQLLQTVQVSQCDLARGF